MPSQESDPGPESVQPATEAALVDRARQGDPTAFNELVNRYERKIYRMARNITQNDEDAEDILQDSFLKAFTHLDSFQGQSKFYTWLVRIAVNESLMRLRKRKSDRTVSLDENIETDEEPIVREIAVWDDNPELRYSQGELRGILDQAIAGSEADFPDGFYPARRGGIVHGGDGRGIGITVAAVKSRLLRARLQLREKLTQDLQAERGSDFWLRVRTFCAS